MDSMDLTTWHEITFKYDTGSGNAWNVFFRYKQIIGGELHARQSKAQQVEAVLACKILNRMGDVGMPNSVAVSA